MQDQVAHVGGTGNTLTRHSGDLGDNQKPSFLEISDEEFNSFVTQKQISKRTLEAIERQREALKDIMPEWVPDYDIITEKHREFLTLVSCL